MNKKQLVAIPAFLLIATLGVSSTALATSVSEHANVTANLGMVNTKMDADLKVRGDSDMHRMDGTRMIFGKVSAISGTTITVTSLTMDKNATTQASTTYTVNASAAVVDKGQVASTVSAIAVGDSVAIEGTVTGTAITATKIHDGVMAKGGRDGDDKNGMGMMEGNGQPIIGGTVTAISGNTITITNKSNVSYTIDATSAKITKSGTVATVSNISVGDSLVAQGTVNGTSVTAVNIVDSGAAANASGNVKVGFFGMIGNFFARLFGGKK